MGSPTLAGMHQPTAPVRHAESADTPPVGVSRRPALSPSRAADFRQCPLLYRFRAIDKIPEQPSRAAVRGTLVHAVLEQLYDLPPAQRVPAAAHALVMPVWEQLGAADAQLRDALFPPADGADAELAAWLASAGPFLDRYFELEDPRHLEPAARELLVEAELESGTLLRGFVDRLDVDSRGATSVVDYKTGAVPRPERESRVLFQLKFYALVLLRERGTVPGELRLLYLSTGEYLTYHPDADELMRFGRLLDALWAAITEAGATGDFRPSPGPACDWCDHKARCPAWGGTPPPYPGWPAGQVAPEPVAPAGA